MMNKRNIYLTLCAITVIFLLGFIVITISTIETVEKIGTITMKWPSPKLLVARYYFEIDNTTELIVDSYDWHKYSIGDIYTWNAWE